MKTLDDADMSPAEYLWHLQTIYGAVVTGAAAGDVDAQALQKDIQKAIPENAGFLKPFIEEATIKVTGAGEKSLQTIKLVSRRKAEFLESDMIWHDLVMLSILGGSSAK